jgi:hypothetical protein
VPRAAPRIVVVSAQVVLEVSFGDDTERAGHGQHAAVGRVDLVDAIACTHELTVTPTRQVELAREDIAHVVLARAATAAERASSTCATYGDPVRVPISPLCTRRRASYATSAGCSNWPVND